MHYCWACSGTHSGQRDANQSEAQSVAEVCTVTCGPIDVDHMSVDEDDCVKASTKSASGDHGGRPVLAWGNKICTP